MNYEPTEKEIDAVRKWQASLKPPLTTDEIRKKESENWAILDEQRKAAAEAAIDWVVDPFTNEKVPRRELDLRNHKRAVDAIAARAAEPVHMTDAEMLAEK
jgi:hypothetical protein